MSALIHDTAFGHLLRLLSRGRYPKYLDEVNPTIWTPFINEEKITFCGPNSEESKSAYDGSSSDPEASKQPKIVSWVGPQDPENPQVCRMQSAMRQSADANPTELAAMEEMFRYVSHLLVHNIRIYWVIHIRCRNSRRHGDFRCIASRSDPWALSLCGWLWHWPHALV